MTVVLHVLEALEGGTARHVRDLVTHVDHVTHHVAVPPVRIGGVTDHAAVAAMTAAGAVVHRVDMRRAPASLTNVNAVARLRRLIGEIAPDVVHGHSSVGGALARLAASSSPGRTRPQRIYTPNGLYPGAPAAAIERALGALTDRLVAVSESEARVIAARGIVAEDRLVVIHNGIDLDGGDAGVIDLSDRGRPGVEAGSVRQQLGLDQVTPLIGFVGRLVSQKNPSLLVDAADLLEAENPEAHVVLIGDGPLAGEIRTRIAAGGRGYRVHLLGHVERAASAMSELDVLVLPSEYEGCPYSVLEAMRAGVPVVASDAVGNRDVVLHSRTGLLFPPADAASLAAAVSLVLGDPERRARLITAARERLALEFDVRTMVLATAALYRQ
jgi:glycosyltransferase involved in cell wall biosynthesis